MLPHSLTALIPLCALDGESSPPHAIFDPTGLAGIFFY